MKTWAIAAFMICFLLFVAAGAQEPKIELARGLSNATSDSALTSDSAVVVTIPAANEFYVGNHRIQKDQLGSKINESLKGRHKANRIVYVASNRAVDYERW